MAVEQGEEHLMTWRPQRGAAGEVVEQGGSGHVPLVERRRVAGQGAEQPVGGLTGL